MTMYLMLCRQFEALLNEVPFVTDQPSYVILSVSEGSHHIPKSYPYFYAPN